MNKKQLQILPPHLSESEYVIGIDEVGRGCFAGPVVVAGIIFPLDFKSDLIRDSKKLTEKQREKAYNVIMDNALAWSIQAIQATKINEIGIEAAISLATKLVLTEVVDKLAINHIIVDGNRFNNPVPDIPYTTIIKGDDEYLPIAAASIVAKVKRDNYMKKVHAIHPQYNFENNKGYFCKKHGDGLIKYGKCRYHRDKYVKTWWDKLKCEVVHHKKEEYDVYIARPSKWGNPFSHKEGTNPNFMCKTREEAIDKYEEWITNGMGKHLLKDLHELKGKRLGCWCKPLPCHGDILKKLVDNLEI